MNCKDSKINVPTLAIMQAFTTPNGIEAHKTPTKAMFGQIWYDIMYMCCRVILMASGVALHVEPAIKTRASNGTFETMPAHTSSPASSSAFMTAKTPRTIAFVPTTYATVNPTLSSCKCCGASWILYILSTTASAPRAMFSVCDCAIPMITTDRIIMAIVISQMQPHLRAAHENLGVRPARNR